MESLSLIRRNCPVCDATGNSAVAEVQGRIRAEDAQRSEIEKKWEGFHSKTCFFDYLRCGNCGMLYNGTYFSEDSIAYLYSSIADNTSGAPMETHNKTQKEYTKILYKKSPTVGPCVEVGPDLGLATSALIDGGISNAAWFVEKNLLSYPALQSLTSKVPVTITDDVSKLPSNVNATVGLLIHVLDHVITPSDTLARIYDSLQSGGLVLVVVHNEKSLLRKTMKSLWPPFRMQHPHLFNSQSLTTILMRAGFENVEIKKSTNFMPLRHAFQLGASSIGLPKSIGKMIPNFEVPLKLGNIVAVARKP